MQCVDPRRIKKNLPVAEFPEGLVVPCGQCIACRISKRREWTIRMMHEMEFHEDNIFITLTYNDESIPENGSLKKKHLQDFFKRLRKRLAREDRKIRIFGCGEYGDKTDRPHYHAIIFGMSLAESDKKMIMDSWPWCDWNRSIVKGSFGLAEHDSISYVAGYIQKKLNGEEAKKEYADKKRESVLSLISPGLGRDYVDRYKDRILDNGCITLRGASLALPRYYLKRLGLPTEDLKTMSIYRDCETTEKYTGVYVGAEDFCRFAESSDMIYLEQRKAQARNQHKKTLAAKVLLKESKI